MLGKAIRQTMFGQSKGPPTACRGWQGKVDRIHPPEANFHFRGPRLFLIGGLSGRFATTDVIQISTASACYIHWRSFSNS